MLVPLALACLKHTRLALFPLSKSRVEVAIRRKINLSLGFTQIIFVN